MCLVDDYFFLIRSLQFLIIIVICGYSDISNINRYLNYKTIVQNYIVCSSSRVIIQAKYINEQCNFLHQTMFDN